MKRILSIIIVLVIMLTPKLFVSGKQNINFINSNKIVSLPITINEKEYFKKIDTYTTMFANDGHKIIFTSSSDNYDGGFYINKIITLPLYIEFNVYIITPNSSDGDFLINFVPYNKLSDALNQANHFVYESTNCFSIWFGDPSDNNQHNIYIRPNYETLNNVYLAHGVNYYIKMYLTQHMLYLYVADVSNNKILVNKYININLDYTKGYLFIVYDTYYGNNKVYISNFIISNRISKVLLSNSYIL